MSAKTIDSATLKRRLDEGRVLLVDIREPDEYAREHIAGASSVPLSRFDASDAPRDAGKAVVFHCKSGNRTAANANRLLARCPGEAYLLVGGLDAWKAAGLPTELDRSAPIDLQRQVQIGAGAMVLLGVALGFLASPLFFALSAFVGTGLMVAGITGFCGLARLLAMMPWNRRRFAVHA